jgi:hypothetical protein
MKLTIIRAFALSCVLAASTMQAAVVWELNPNNQNQSVGSSSIVLTSSGYHITATGYDNVGGVGQATDLFFKSAGTSGGAIERGLGLTNSPHNELNAGNPVPNFMQLDLTSILALGFTNGRIAVASLQDGEGFQLFGSNAMGVLGTAISGPFTGLAFDDQFVSIPSFGMFQYISIIADTGNVLPARFEATVVPEVGAILPILGLFVAIGSTTILRRRAGRIAGRTA